MPSIEEISGYQTGQAQARSAIRAIELQRQVDGAERAADYVGYDAALGLHITQTLGDAPIANMRSLTNAGLQPGDSVAVEGATLDAMPKVRSQEAIAPVLAGRESFATLLFGAIITDALTFPGTTTLKLWLLTANEPLKTFQIPLGFASVGQGLVFYILGDVILSVCERDRQIVQINLGEVSIAMPTVGAPELVFFPQPAGLVPGGYYDTYPDRLEQKKVNLLTFYVEQGEIRLIEGTDTFALPTGFEGMQYSSFFAADLPYLLFAAGNLYSTEENPTIVSYSNLGRFEFTEPEPFDFLALKNFFGVEPVPYFLGEGDRLTFPVTLEDLGLEIVRDSQIFDPLRNLSYTFEDWVNSTYSEAHPDAGKLRYDFRSLTYGDNLSIYLEVAMKPASIRGGLF